MDINVLVSKIEEYLYSTANDKKRAWTKKIVNTRLDVLAGQMADIKKIAKYIIRNGFKEEFITNEYKSSYEIVILRGFTIAYDSKNSKMLDRLDRYLNDVDNWSCIDSIASAVKRRDDEYREYLLGLLHHDNEWHVRYGIVALMDNYFNDDLMASLEVILSVTKYSYYIDMAIAWAISVAYVKGKDEIFELLKARFGDYINGKSVNENVVDSMIIKYSIQKVKDSYRLDDMEVKKFINLFQNTIR